MRIQFTLNGASRHVETRPGKSVLDLLREHCGVVSPKDGCQPQASAAPASHGQSKVTYAIAAEKADGREIVKLEGIPTDERDLVARAFASAGAVQCGFCIPGIALRAVHLVRTSRSPTRAEIARAIDVHLCRCTGYVKILDAIELMAAATSATRRRSSRWASGCTWTT